VNSTIVLGIASIVFALTFRAQAHELPLEAQRLPSLLIWIVIALAAMMVVEELLKQRAARRGSDAVLADDDEPLPPINWAVLAIFCAAAIAYVALIPIAGYLLITPIFLIAGFWFSKTMLLSTAVLVGVVTTALIWGLFIWLLQLPVPLFPSLN
jgi:hypothetical protein